MVESKRILFQLSISVVKQSSIILMMWSYQYHDLIKLQILSEPLSSASGATQPWYDHILSNDMIISSYGAKWNTKKICSLRRAWSFVLNVSRGMIMSYWRHLIDMMMWSHIGLVIWWYQVFVANELFFINHIFVSR